MEGKETILAHLELLQAVCPPTEAQHAWVDWLRAKGVWFAAATPAAEWPWLDAWVRGNKPRPRRCYYNSWRLATDKPQLRYYEGLYHDTLLPVGHAWVTGPDGRHFDVTMEAADQYLRSRGFAPRREGATYFGVHVPTAFLREHAAETGQAGPLAAPYFQRLRAKGEL